MRLAGLLLLRIILLEFVAAVAAMLNQATATIIPAVTSALLAQVLLNIKSPFPPGTHLIFASQWYVFKMAAGSTQVLSCGCVDCRHF